MTEPYDPYPPTPSGPAQPPLPAVRPGQLTGTATGVQTRVEGGRGDRPGETVLSFRLQVADRDRPVDVELRAFRLTGTVHEGDQVVVPGSVGRSGLVAAKQVQNLTTGTVVGAAQVNRVARAVFLTVFALILVVFVIVMVAVVVGLASS